VAHFVFGAAHTALVVVTGVAERREHRALERVESLAATSES